MQVIKISNMVLALNRHLSYVVGICTKDTLKTRELETAKQGAESGCEWENGIRDEKQIRGKEIKGIVRSLHTPVREIDVSRWNAPACLRGLTGTSSVSGGPAPSTFSA